MANNETDPKDVWKSQPTDARMISAAEIRNVARRANRKTRLRRFIGAAAFVLYFSISILVRISSDQRHADLAGWTGLIRFALLIIWVSGLRYYVDPGLVSLNLNAGELAGLDYYRRQLLVQLDYFRTPYRWLPMFLLVVLSFAAAAAVDRLLVIPLGVLFAVFAGVSYWQWKRESPQLQEELRAIQALMRPR
jgi:hypothetical protein